MSYDIQQIPTYMMFVDGMSVDRKMETHRRIWIRTVGSIPFRKIDQRVNIGSD